MCLAFLHRQLQKTVGGNLKTTITAAALVCGSLAANAETLLVEYQGTVSSVDQGLEADAPGHAVGDSITGSLLIDLTLAPPDAVAGDPSIGRYGSPGIDFILGPRPPNAPGTGDLLLVYDDWAGSPDGLAPYDGFLVRDQSIGVDGNFNLVLGMQRPNLLGQLFADDSLAQSFDLQPDPGTNFWGFIERGFGELWSVVNFTLDRFSVKPGACRI
jgi:hypothetical protein